MLNAHIIQIIEGLAPRNYQESWDNTGWQVGSAADECRGVLLCVDCSPSVVAEAKERGCNLIISHHPLLFKGLKRLTGATPVEQTVIMATRAGISIYSSHTSLDNVPGGVSYTMARMLGLDVLRALAPMSPRWSKLSVMVPADYAEQVRMSLFDVGAGEIRCGAGNCSTLSYDCCSYNTEGYGTFRPLEGSRPFVGDVDTLRCEPETRISMVVDNSLINRAMDVIREVHPYESPAIEVSGLTNAMSEIGLGAVCACPEGLTAAEFIQRVKDVFGSPVVRHTAIHDPGLVMRRIALCGGAGGEFIGDALNAGAQVYLSSDIRYHDFQDYQDRILLVDIGHFESEQCTKQIFYDVITQKIANFAVYKSSVEKNPINYT